MSPATKANETVRLTTALAEREQELARLKAEIERRQIETEATLRAQDDQRRALLHMLEELEVGRRQIERARKEWTDSLDAVRDPIFIHDREFRVVRANRAYAEHAGMDIREVIGKSYWEVFPKNDGPMPACARHVEKAEEEEGLNAETCGPFSAPIACYEAMV